MQRFCSSSCVSKVALIILAVSIRAFPACGQFATIRGNVSTPSGAPAEDLKVWIVDSTGKNPRRHAEVKSPPGDYIIERVPFGSYLMFACDSPGYAPSEKSKVTVDQEDIRRVNFVLRDPLSRKGHLTGGVQGPKGIIAGLPIEVTLRDVETGCELAKARTNQADGRFEFTGLAAPRSYEFYSDLVAGAPVRVDVEDGKIEQANLVLDMGGYQSLVELAARTPGTNIRELVQGDTVTVEVTVTGEVPQLTTDAALPLQSREVYQLAILAPGVFGDSRHLRGTGSVGGQSAAADPNSNSATLALGNPVPAQDGDDFPAVVSIGHTGTNGFHGNVLYLFRNNALDAHNFFSLPNFAILRQQKIAGDVGGPVWKDHVFFFFKYDFGRHTEAPTFSPTITSNLSNLNQQLARLGLPFEDLRRFTSHWLRDSPLVRFDLNLSKTQQVTVRYGFNHVLNQNLFSEERGGTPALPSSTRNVSSNNHTLSAQYDASFHANDTSHAAYDYRHTFLGSAPKELNEIALMIPGIAILGRSTDLSNGEGGGFTNHTVKETLNIMY